MEAINLMLASCLAAAVALAASYITTTAGQKVLMTAANAANITLIDAFCFSILGILSAALLGRNFERFYGLFEDLSDFFLALATTSLVGVILHNRFTYIIYIPCMIHLLLIMWKLRCWPVGRIARIRAFLDISHVFDK